ncbi:cytochrome C assembly family protein [Moraxella nasicaprae]|uniref:Cytochrome c biogenesis protein CcsA n=1 Tax=Moraxella nasicaprae TaxID=2904122 RepID=A0ABY6F4T3_9GAMM|nr:cytochrome c biogenesis protein CcsA [Moraxella nasicaprae]UXZ05098.1 cytochrome c biogenesis protein CcsA [Moraxella nasicaprae]
MLIVFLMTTIIYSTSSVYLTHTLLQKTTPNKFGLLGFLILGVCLHGYLLYPQIMTLHGLNFNLFNTLSLTSLFFVIFYVLFGLYRPILSLGILAVPIALAGVSTGYFGKASYQPIASLNIGLQLHILLSFAAYCVLLMAAVQGFILKLQIKELKHQTIHRFWVSRLPALQSMEGLLFDMILMGFVILSIALGFGFVATYDILDQHIAHKMFFSLASWVVFGILIAGHYLHGWRGKRAANFTIYGFILLAIGFVGSKAVLELIL